MRERIAAYIEGLSSREKSILVAFGGLVALFIVAGIYLFFNEAVETRRTDLQERNALLAKIEGYREHFRRARERESQFSLAVQTNQTNLNSYLNGVRETFGVEIATIKELKAEKKGEFLKEMVEVGIRSIDMPTLMSFLYALENRARLVFVDSLAIKKRFDGKNYEVTLVVATLKEAAEK